MRESVCITAIQSSLIIDPFSQFFRESELSKNITYFYFEL